MADLVVMEMDLDGKVNVAVRRCACGGLAICGGGDHIPNSNRGHRREFEWLLQNNFNRRL